jgi:two-component system cell cycle sensor histidine kinase PleC
VSIRSRLVEAFRDDPKLTGHVRFLAAPAYRRFLRLEPYIRRSIPVLIVGFISILAITRAAGLLEQRQMIEEAAGAQVSLVTAALSTELSDAELRYPSDNPREVLRMVLDERLAELDAVDGRLILLTAPDGTVVATSSDGRPATAHLVAVAEKRPLAALIGTSYLASVGRHVHAVELTLSTGADAVVSIDNLERRSNRPLRLGSVAVVQLKDAILTQWRADVRNSVLLFVATAAVLLVLTYAYFAQVARAAEADGLYGDTVARSETAFKRGRCGLWDWDLGRGRIYWASAIFEMLGLPPDDGIMGFGQLVSLVHPEDIDLAALANRMVSGDIGTLDQAFRMRHSDGQWLWFRVRAEVVERADTGSRHLIGTAADITEHKALADMTATADLRLRDAIETISEAFVLWDADNRLVMCNSKYQQLHNLSDFDIRPLTPYATVMRAARQPTIRTPLPIDGFDDIETREAGARTYEAQIDDGRWLQINERRTKDGGYVSVGTDITMLKLHEERLLDSEKRLIGTIADLRQSRHEALTQTQKFVEMAEKYNDEKIRAEEANKIKSDFLANISHELRTPLNAIIGFSEIICAGYFGPDKYREYGQDILDSGTFLLNVINDILDMSKIEAGRLELAMTDVDLGEILEESTRVLSFQVEEKQLSVEVVCPEKIQLRADRRAIKQILLNLLSNAVKFTPHGGRVIVSADLAGNTVRVAIADTGIGIPRSQIDQLGRPFVQVANQFTKTHRGSGLGLAIARSLIELHGGEMEIASTPGHGTTVSFGLPRHAKAAGTETVQPESVVA